MNPNQPVFTGDNMHQEQEFAEKPFYKSKKFWASIIAVIIPVINQVFSLELDAQELVPIMAPALVYVVGQGMADLGKNP